MTANVGIAERADRLVAVLAATGLVGLGVPEILLTVVLALLAVASLVTVCQRMLTVRRQALDAAREARRRRASRVDRLPARRGRRCAACPSARHTACSTASPTLTTAPRRRRRAAAAVQLRPCPPGAGARGAGRPRPRTACAPTCATTARPSGCRTAAPRRSGPASGPSAMTPCARRSPRARRSSCFLGHLGNWDTAGAWASRELGPVVTVAERLKPEELYRRVPRLPGVPRHDHPPADRGRRRLRRAARPRSPRPVICRCSPTAT